MTRQRAERKGRWGEHVAAWWLMLHGWHIVARRVRTGRGEIDLIARRRHVVAFVEVKTRGNAKALALAIDDFRLRRVVAAVDAVAHRFAGQRDDIRIDVILVRPWALPVHMTNVWHG